MLDNNNTAILVLSCDKYADAWQPFFLFFQKYWKDCQFPLYLGTNNKRFAFPNVTQIFSNKTTTWSDELKTILKQIPEKNIIIILEDYFITKPVRNSDILNLVDVMEKTNATFLKLGLFPTKFNSLWPHTSLKNFNNIASINKGSKYRICLQIAIWNKEHLLELLVEQENPWQFEIEGSKRANQSDKLFLTIMPDKKARYVHGPINYLCTALTNGKWMQDALRLAKKENITIDTSNYPIETYWEEMKRKFYSASPIWMRQGLDFISSRLHL